jgi:hypothetical protein
MTSQASQHSISSLLQAVPYARDPVDGHDGMLKNPRTRGAHPQRKAPTSKPTSGVLHAGQAKVLTSHLEAPLSRKTGLSSCHTAAMYGKLPNFIGLICNLLDQVKLQSHCQSSQRHDWSRKQTNKTKPRVDDRHARRGTSPR